MSSAPPVMTSLQIGAYRRLRRLQLEMAPITLIVGAQSSGKSSVLEAGSLVLRPSDPGQWSSMLRRRDMDVSVAEGLWTCFPDSFDLGEEAEQSRAIEIEVTLDPTRVRARTKASMKAFATRGGYGNLNVNVEASFDGDHTCEPITRRISFPGMETETWRAPAPLCPTFSLGSSTYGKLFADGVLSATQRGYKVLLVWLLQSADSDICDVMAIPGSGNRSTVVIGFPGPRHDGKRWVDLCAIGDGLRRVLALGISLIRAARGVFFIDDLENSLCTSSLANTVSPVMETFLQIADQLQTQIIASTNSLELIDSVLTYLQDTPNRSSDLILHRLWIEHTNRAPQVRSYDQAQALRLRDGGLDIR